MTEEVLYQDDYPTDYHETFTTRPPGDTGHYAALASAQILPYHLLERGSTGGPQCEDVLDHRRKIQGSDSVNQFRRGIAGTADTADGSICICAWIPYLLALHEHSPEESWAVETLCWLQERGKLYKKHEGSPTS